MELETLNKEITRLMRLRIKMYGKEWHKTSEPLRTLDQSLKLRTRIFEYSLENNIPIYNLCPMIGIDTATYYNMATHKMHYGTEKSILDFFNEND